jgi:hypothetical protein
VFRRERQLSRAAQEFLEIATQPFRKRDSEGSGGRTRGAV